MDEDVVVAESHEGHRSYKLRIRRQRSPKEVHSSSSEDAGLSPSLEKRNRKRKSPSSVCDPSYSDSEDEEFRPEHLKKVPGYRCSPHLIPELFSKLIEKQKGWVRKIGFHSLEGMIDSRMPKGLTMWLVDRVDTTTGTLEVCGMPIDIRKAVPNILNIPCGDMKVPPPLNGRSKSKRFRGDSSLSDQKYSDKGRGKTAKDATVELVKEVKDEAEFCRSFVMLVLCIYLAPTTSLNINRNFYPALMDVSKIGKMDWCGFIADYLIQGISEYRNSKSHHVQVPGCVHLLLLIYIDALINSKALMLPEALSVPEGVPRIHYIGSRHLSFLASVDVKSRSKDKIEYGLLQESSSSVGGVSKKSRTLFCSNKIEELSAGQPGVPSSSSSVQVEEIFAADFIRGLFEEINKSRQEFVQQVVQDIQQKMEASDQKLLSSLQRLFLHQYVPSANANGFHVANRKATGSPPPCEVVNTSSSPVPKYPKSSCPTENPPSPLISSTSQQTKITDFSPNEASVIGPKTRTPLTNTGVSDKGRGTSKEQAPELSMPPPRMMAGKQCESTIQPEDQHREQPSPRQLNIGESHDESDWVLPRKGKSGAESSPSLQQDPKQVTSDMCLDDLAEVVSIGAAAVHEANFNQEKDACSNWPRTPLAVLSDAAQNARQALYDQTPVCRFMSAETTSHFTCGTSLNPPSCSPLFREKVATSPVLSLTFPVYGPVHFDRSPTTPSVFPSLDKTLSSASVKPSSCNSEGAVQLPAPDIGTEALSVSLDEVVKAAPPSDMCPAHASKPNQPDPTDLDIDKSSQAIVSLTQMVSNYSQSSKSMCSESDDETDPIDATPEDGDVDAIEDRDFFNSTPSVEDSPRYTLGDSQEVIQVPDGPVNTGPSDTLNVPPLQEELTAGFRFKFGGSVCMATFKMYEKFKQLDNIDPQVADIVNQRFVLTKDAAQTYQDHVLSSVGRSSSRFRNIANQNRQKTKILIKGFHVTVGEYVDALKPNGEVCQNLMGVCSVAIMLDWDTKSKVILDQPTIEEFLKDCTDCDCISMAGRLLKLPLEEIEEMYLPVLKDSHWILAVVNFPRTTVELYDSLLSVVPGNHPHRDLWSNLAGNLRESYCKARKKTVMIDNFEVKYPANKLQTTLHDCGLHVIQQIECHNVDDLVGFSKKKTMMPYRKYLSHILLYHRFNDLNPYRPVIL